MVWEGGQIEQIMERKRENKYVQARLIGRQICVESVVKSFQRYIKSKYEPIACRQSTTAVFKHHPSSIDTKPPHVPMHVCVRSCDKHTNVVSKQPELGNMNQSADWL